MTRYARRPNRGGRFSWLRSGASSAGAAISRNPVAVGGTTAFLVSMAFVSANALFYQPQMHPNAFVSTRAPAAIPAPDPEVEPEHPQPAAAPREVSAAAPTEETVTPAPAPESTGSVPEPGGDATVREIQTVLGELGLYRGEVDGMAGPQTDSAIKSYRRIVGLEPGTEIDTALLRQLGLDESATPSPTALPKPAPRPSSEDTQVQTVSLGGSDAVIQRVQGGLKAFGNEAIEVDGVMGDRTRDAIREFQSLFGLPVTGEPDKEFLAKMQEIGLIN